MLTRQVRSFALLHRRFIHSTRCNRQNSRKPEHPFSRTVRILSEDLKNLTNMKKYNEKIRNVFPSHTDVVIIGGGAMGSSIAYWLKEKTGKDSLDVVVLEQDPTYKSCSTCLSVGGVRQQFSLPENIQMSLFGAEFIRTLPRRFGPKADVFFTPHGYLVLANEQHASELVDNSKLQKELGAVNEILSKEQLKRRFPWLNVNDVELGCLGLEKEGWFDPWSLLTLLKNGAQEQGARFVDGQVVDFTFQKKLDIYVEGIECGDYEGLDEVVVKLPNGELKSIKFAVCILAAGCESGEIAKLARIGNGPGMLTVPLPVERRKRYVFRWDCQGEGPGLNTPMTIDYTGSYFRRDGLGGAYIGGICPSPEEEPGTDNLEVDHQYFDDKLWPNLANRVPAFNSLKVRGAWAGYYDFNAFDENGIIGAHPYYYNFYMATGFSGHGIQQAPAVGRAIAELIVDGNFQTIDLTRLGFNRLLNDKPMLELRIY